MREAEAKLETLTGYKLKVVERAGTKLVDILTKSDPWQGADCGREDCLLCLTKAATGKNKTQDCTRRNLVYETWCMNCLERDEEAAKIEAGEDKDMLKHLTGKIKKYMYVGETARSTFERSWEHVHDMKSLSTKSHMLKHAVDARPNEELSTLRFGIKVIKYARKAFDRQIFESVAIEENRLHHHLLNSRSEFNRSAVPRLVCKLGDNTYKKFEKEMEEEKEKEEGLVSKIRSLVKERNKLRAHHQRKLPPSKRRKLDPEHSHPVGGGSALGGEQTGHYPSAQYLPHSQ